MKTIRDVLRAVDAKLSSKDKWTKNEYARNSLGKRCAENSPEATCHCLVGAVISVTEDPKHPGIANELGTSTLIFINLLLSETSTFKFKFEGHIHRWNDAPERTFKEVKSFLQLAKSQA